MKKRLLVTLMLSTGLFVSACMAAPITSPTPPVPGDVRALVASTDTLLAYKAADLYGDGTRSAAIVIRHPLSGKSDYNFDNNPCELQVLHEKSGTLAVADRSTKAVDCTYNDVARSAPAMSLNDNLTVAPASVVYVNQKDKGYSAFYLAWSEEKHSWYLQRATASNPDGNRFAEVSATYPKDFGWMTMSSVDPDTIAQILESYGNASK